MRKRDIFIILFICAVLVCIIWILSVLQTERRQGIPQTPEERKELLEVLKGDRSAPTQSIEEKNDSLNSLKGEDEGGGGLTDTEKRNSLRSLNGTN
jgi:hypothetical protein